MNRKMAREKANYELHSESEVLIAKTEQALKKAGKQLDRSEKHQIKSAMNQLKKSVVKMKPMKMRRMMHISFKVRRKTWRT